MELTKKQRVAYTHWKKHFFLISHFVLYFVGLKPAKITKGRGSKADKGLWQSESNIFLGTFQVIFCLSLFFSVDCIPVELFAIIRLFKIKAVSNVC